MRSPARRRGESREAPRRRTPNHDRSPAHAASAKRSVRSNASREHRLGHEQADDQKRLVREIEEVARVHEDALARQQIEDQRLFAARGRHPHDSRPATFHAAAACRPDTPPPCGGRAAGCARRGREWRRERRRRVRGGTRRPPAPACPPTETCRRSAPGPRVPRARSSAGPPTTVHPSFTCGRPIDFDAPPRENVSTWARAARSVNGASSSRT